MATTKGGGLVEFDGEEEEEEEAEEEEEEEEEEEASALGGEKAPDASHEA